MKHKSSFNRNHSLDIEVHFIEIGLRLVFEDPSRRIKSLHISFKFQFQKMTASLVIFQGVKVMTKIDLLQLNVHGLFSEVS